MIDPPPSKTIWFQFVADGYKLALLIGMRAHKWIFALMFTFSLSLYAQESDQADQPPNANQPPNNGGWRRFGEPAGRPMDVPPVSGPLTLPAGSWITVRVNQPLSSDHNQPGDNFTATLAQPLVANGRVIARRGQTVEGSVVEAQKAGHVKGTSRLGLELIELSLADGRQAPIHTRMMERQGDTSVGQDVGAIGAGTAIGAVIGGAADGGFGAGIGAIAGAAASTIGVLATRGRDTVVYPEMVLTFRLEAPITVGADASPEAFLPVSQQDYEQRANLRQGPPPQMRRPVYGGYPAPYYDYYPPYYYGPSVYIYSGPRYYRGRGYYRR